MASSAHNILLALRAPNAHWLAALVNALDEALKDPSFGEEQRVIVAQLLEAGIVPASVARAAEARFTRDEESFGDYVPSSIEPEWPASTAPATSHSRPKLTLVGNAAA